MGGGGVFVKLFCFLKLVLGGGGDVTPSFKTNRPELREHLSITSSGFQQF